VSLHETPLTRDYWRRLGLGTLYPEFRAVGNQGRARSRRDVDGVIVLDTEYREASRSERPDLDGRDVVVVQTKAARLNVFLMGQGLLSPDLIRQSWSPASLRSVMLCTRDDPTLQLLLASHMNLECYVVPGRVGSVSVKRIAGTADRVWRRLGGGLLAPAALTATWAVEGLIIQGPRQEKLHGFASDLVRGQDVCLVHSYRESLGMYVAGEAIFAAAHVRGLGARSVRSLLVVGRKDTAVDEAMRRHTDAVDVEIAVV
jgi:hypothetical protein